MRHYKLLIAAIFPALLGICICGCNSDGSNNEESVKCCKISGYTDEQFDSIFEFERYVVLETNDVSVIRNITKLLATDSCVYILDANRRVLIFGNDGHFIRNIEHIGAGPEEYANLRDFNLNSDTLMLLDPDNSRILVYTDDDRFVRAETALQARGIWRFDNGTTAYNMGFGLADGKKRERCFYAVTEDGNMKTALNFNKALLGRSFSHNGALPFYYSNGYPILFTKPFDSSLYLISESTYLPETLLRFETDDTAWEITPETPEAEVNEIVGNGGMNNFFAVYRWENDIMVGYESKKSPYTYAIVDINDLSVKLNQPLGRDSHGFPVMPYSYIYIMDPDLNA